MAFAHLTFDQLKKLKVDFGKITAGYLQQERVLLMNRVAPTYLQVLDQFDNDFNQLTSDLNSLNRLPKLPDGSIPLALWLENAIDLFAPFPEVETFKTALEDLKRGPAQNETEVIVDGIQALVAMIKGNQAAKSAVNYYRRNFERRIWEIDVIANYKRMHDDLHKVQLDWPDAKMAGVFLGYGGAMRRTLENRSALLDQTNADLRSTYQNGYVDKKENRWIDQLETKQKELEQAFAANSADKIKEGFDSIKGVLTLELSNLNTHLKDAISRLHLDELIAAMNDVCKELATFTAAKTTEQIEQYKAGVEKLRARDQELRELIKEHDDWQGIDTLLRALGDSLKHLSSADVRNAVTEAKRITYLEMIKDLVTSRVDPLIEAKTTHFAVKLAEASQRFRGQVEHKDTDAAEEEFDTYRDLAWHCFFDIDSKMKEQCEELARIGQELRKVNNQLKFNDELDLE